MHVQIYELNKDKSMYKCLWLFRGGGDGAAQKKPGAGAAQKKQEPEPPILGGPGSGSLWLIIKQIDTGAPLTPPPSSCVVRRVE